MIHDDGLMILLAIIAEAVDRVQASMSDTLLRELANAPVWCVTTMHLLATRRPLSCMESSRRDSPLGCPSNGARLFYLAFEQHSRGRSLRFAGPLKAAVPTGAALTGSVLLTYN